MAKLILVRLNFLCGYNLHKSVKIHFTLSQAFLPLILRGKKDGSSTEAMQMKPQRDINESTKHKEYSFLINFHKALLNPPISFINHSELINSEVWILRTEVSYNASVYSKLLEVQLIKTTL